MRYRFIILVMLCLGLVLNSTYAEVSGSDFKLVFTTDNCNCDSDCEDLKSCVTPETDSFVTTLSDRTDNKISDANNDGYNGVCASILMANEPMEWPMTENCDSQLECTKDSDCNSGYDCKEYKCEEKPPECTKDSDCREGFECKSKKCEEKEGYCKKDSDCDDGYECTNHGCTEKEEEDEPDSDEGNTSGSRVVRINYSEQDNSDDENKSVTIKNRTGGIDMDVVSVSIVSATIIIVGFFALMAWTAYLLQKRPNGK